MLSTFEENLSQREGVSSLKGVIFDMDGTLTNSTQADYLTWKRLFEKHKKSISYEEYVPLLGIKSSEVIKRYLKLDGIDLVRALDEKLGYFEDILHTQGITLVPFAQEFLEKAKQSGCKVALATSSRWEKMKMVMQSVGLLDSFDAIVTGDEVKNSKPSPDIFLEAAKRLSLTPDECVVIEDAGNGVLAAKNAGMFCVAITTTHKPEMLRYADIIINSYEDEEAKEIFEKILNKC